MKHRIAFSGFRHPHILSLWQKAWDHPDCEIVASYESHPATRDELTAAGKVSLTHDDFATMLAESDCTIVAIGDVYALRGAQTIAALKAGKHVIADKPICTSLEELEEITTLAREKNLSVGCQLDLVEAGVVRRLQEVVRSGTIGRPCTINVSAQHPLRYGVRAGWYFEPGQHGGTINDIGVHVFDLAPWLTGSPWQSTLLAREWNAKATEAPHFQDCAQFYGVLENQTACFADVSYLGPDALGYGIPQYWRITVHGTKGVAEACYTQPTITVVTDDDKTPQVLDALTTPVTGYLQDFLTEITDKPVKDGINTERVLNTARLALEAQALAQKNS